MKWYALKIYQFMEAKIFHSNVSISVSLIEKISIL